MRKVLSVIEVGLLAGALVLSAIWFYYPHAGYGWYVFVLMFAAVGVIEYFRSQMNASRREVLKDLKPIFESRALTEGTRKDTLYTTFLAVQSSIRALQNGELDGRRIPRVEDLYDSDPLKAELQKLLKGLQRLSKLFDDLERKKRLAKTDSAVTPMVFTGDPGQVARSVRALEFQRKRVLEVFRSLGETTT